MAHHSEIFGRLLKSAISSVVSYEGKKTAIVEEELGRLMGVSGSTVERYKGGYVPDEPERIKVLAEAAVRRGLLGREWLGRFLHAARYPERERLLDQLTPQAPQRPRPPRVYENLPAPTYSQFVMRQQAFADVLDGLQQRSAVVLVVGLGGNGKTSLAREVAARCLKDKDDAPSFDAVVWVSDKDRPGTTNLSTVLDELARTLDYPGFTQFEHDDKRREVEQLLRRQRVLLVVDNFETITDGALLSWLLRLPEPSKALITSREYGRAFRNSTVVLDLRGMSDAEAQTLVAQRLRVLRLEQLVSDQSQLEPLVAVTGGNPKAIEIALGLVKYERRPLQQVVDDLHAARGDLFDDLFARAWSLLDEAARRVLLVATFFPTTASGEALAATADVQGYSFERALERLTHLALLDVQQEDLNHEARYELHPLVRVFAKAQLVEQPILQNNSRDRWLCWYKRLAAEVGFCYTEQEHLKRLDAEYETVSEVIKWAYNKRYDADVIKLHRGVAYYLLVRGLWARALELSDIRIKASLRCNDSIAAISAVANRCELLSRQGQAEEVEKHLFQIRELVKYLQDARRVQWAIPYVQAMAAMAQDNLQGAIEFWEEYRSAVDSRSTFRIFALRWLATCYFHQNQLDLAQELFIEAQNRAVAIGQERSILIQEIYLAAIDLLRGSVHQASIRLNACCAVAIERRDRPTLAEAQQYLARLHILQGNLPAARTSLADAIDLFERLGMRRELAEARAALADLGTEEASAT